jgi:amyloid beta precursor protein binding protein 1
LINELLGELNDMVTGTYEDIDLHNYLKTKPDQLTQFTLIILSKELDTSEEDLIQLSELCEANNIPLILTEAVGFVGYLKVAAQEHTIVETHPDSLVDLRLVDPFAELLEFTESFGNIDEIQDADKFNQIPSVILLLHYLQKWKNSNEGRVPSNYKEKKLFKETLPVLKREFVDLENLSEALEYVNFHVKPYQVPRDILALFDSHNLNLTQNSSNFWVLVKSLKQYYENEGEGKYLPVTGAIPDIRTSTDSYIKLKQIYQQKAESDKAIFLNYLTKNLQELGRPEDFIEADDVTIFCKHSSYLKVQNYDKIHKEYNETISLKQSLFNQSEDAWFYIALLARHKFIKENSRLPNHEVDTDAFNADIAVLENIITPIINSWGISDASALRNYLIEVSRSGEFELTTTASVIGGLIAQESIKLITRQYVPIEGVALFNGVKGSISTFKI